MGGGGVTGGLIELPVGCVDRIITEARVSDVNLSI